jgi:hypothetical protein
MHRFIPRSYPGQNRLPPRPSSEERPSFWPFLENGRFSDLTRFDHFGFFSLSNISPPLPFCLVRWYMYAPRCHGIENALATCSLSGRFSFVITYIVTVWLALRLRHISWFRERGIRTRAERHDLQFLKFRRPGWFEWYILGRYLQRYIAIEFGKWGGRNFMRKILDRSCHIKAHRTKHKLRGVVFVFHSSWENSRENVMSSTSPSKNKTNLINSFFRCSFWCNSCCWSCS